MLLGQTSFTHLRFKGGQVDDCELDTTIDSFKLYLKTFHPYLLRESESPYSVCVCGGINKQPAFSFTDYSTTVPFIQSRGSTSNSSARPGKAEEVTKNMWSTKCRLFVVCVNPSQTCPRNSLEYLSSVYVAFSLLLKLYHEPDDWVYSLKVCFGGPL